MRRHFDIFAMAGFCLAAVFSPLSYAQDYPAKPVRVTVPWPPGGGTDVMGRLMAVRLSARLGQPVVVENRAGAASNMGMAAVATSAPDGYTLGLATSNLAVNPVLMASMPFDPARDLLPVALLAKGTYAMAVHPAVPAQNLQQLLALVREAPAKTPRSVVERLNAEVRVLLVEPDVVERLLSLGAEVQSVSPEALGSLLSAETARLGKLVRDAGITAE